MLLIISRCAGAFLRNTLNPSVLSLTECHSFQTLFPLITVVLCFLHGFLKIRDRCRKAHELHRRV